MKRKILAELDRLSTALKCWEGVECLCVGDTAEEDILSPYFSLVLDVYYRGSVPAWAERQRAFAWAEAYEGSDMYAKDRFLVDGLPVHIEYKDMGMIEALLAVPEELHLRYKEPGTYMLHRLKEWSVHFERSDWLKAMRARLDMLPEAFWHGMREHSQLKMDHALSDYGAAIYAGDRFFSVQSLATFLRYAAASLFMINRVFEPSQRRMSERVLALPVLPESFAGRWESFLASNVDSPDERKFEIARLIARSILRM
jgi:hypothetical protein